jgi:hypothetical protein
VLHGEGGAEIRAGARPSERPPRAAAEPPLPSPPPAAHDAILFAVELRGVELDAYLALPEEVGVAPRAQRAAQDARRAVDRATLSASPATGAVAALELAVRESATSAASAALIVPPGTGAGESTAEAAPPVTAPGGTPAAPPAAPPTPSAASPPSLLSLVDETPWPGIRVVARIADAALFDTVTRPGHRFALLRRREVRREGGGGGGGGRGGRDTSAAAPPAAPPLHTEAARAAALAQQQFQLLVAQEEAMRGATLGGEAHARAVAAADAAEDAAVEAQLAAGASSSHEAGVLGEPFGMPPLGIVGTQAPPPVAVGGSALPATGSALTAALPATLPAALPAALPPLFLIDARLFHPLPEPLAHDIPVSDATLEGVDVVLGMRAAALDVIPSLALAEPLAALLRALPAAPPIETDVSVRAADVAASGELKQAVAMRLNVAAASASAAAAAPPSPPLAPAARPASASILPATLALAAHFDASRLLLAADASKPSGGGVVVALELGAIRAATEAAPAAAGGAPSVAPAAGRGGSLDILGVAIRLLERLPDERIVEGDGWKGGAAEGMAYSVEAGAPATRRLASPPVHPDRLWRGESA